MVATTQERSCARTIRLRNILFPTDFSDASRAALPWAEEIARANGAMLHLAHVACPAFAEPFEALPFAEGLMKQLKSRVSWPNKRTWIVEGLIEQAMPEIAVQSQADWLVIGTHGRSGISRFLLGSIAEEILRVVQIPALTIGPRPMTAGATAFRDILCAIDSTLIGTALADRVESYAAELACDFGAELTVKRGQIHGIHETHASLVVQGMAPGSSMRAAVETMRLAPCPTLTIRG